MYLPSALPQYIANDSKWYYAYILNVDKNATLDIFGIRVLVVLTLFKENADMKVFDMKLAKQSHRKDYRLHGHINDNYFFTTVMHITSFIVLTRRIQPSSYRPTNIASNYYKIIYPNPFVLKSCSFVLTTDTGRQASPFIDQLTLLCSYTNHRNICEQSLALYYA